MHGCEVSVLIPVKNGGPLFRRCLSMVLSQRTSFVFEVIVIDSGSTDGTLEFMDALRDPRLTVKHIEPEQFNHGATRNQAAGLARGELLVFMVQDAVPGSVSWLENFAARMSDESLAGVFARQVPREESGFFVKRGVERGFASSLHPGKVTLSSWAEFLQMQPLERLRFCYFDNVCSCIRRSVWREFPFEEVNFGEDIRWARRVLLKGKCLGYEPASFVYHSHDRPMAYTFKRICLDHWNLYGLFGVETIPRLRDAVKAFTSSVELHLALALEAPVPGKEKLRLLAESFTRPLAEVSAQYWAVRLARAGRRPRFRGV